MTWLFISTVSSCKPRKWIMNNYFQNHHQSPIFLFTPSRIPAFQPTEISIFWLWFHYYKVNFSVDVLGLCPCYCLISDMFLIAWYTLIFMNSSFWIFLQGKISCSMHVNALNQTVVRQDCYPDWVNSVPLQIIGWWSLLFSPFVKILVCWMFVSSSCSVLQYWQKILERFYWIV